MIAFQLVFSAGSCLEGRQVRAGRQGSGSLPLFLLWGKRRKKGIPGKRFHMEKCVIGQERTGGEGKEDRGGREGTGKRTRKSRTGARRKKSRAGGRRAGQEEEEQARRKKSRAEGKERVIRKRKRLFLSSQSDHRSFFFSKLHPRLGGHTGHQEQKNRRETQGPGSRGKRPRAAAERKSSPPRNGPTGTGPPCHDRK